MCSIALEAVFHSSHTERKKKKRGEIYLTFGLVSFCKYFQTAVHLLHAPFVTSLAVSLHPFEAALIETVQPRLIVFQWHSFLIPEIYRQRKERLIKVVPLLLLLLS